MRTGVDLEEALMVLVPEAYRNHPDLMANYPEARPVPRNFTARRGMTPALAALLQAEHGPLLESGLTCGVATRDPTSNAVSSWLRRCARTEKTGAARCCSTLLRERGTFN